MCGEYTQGATLHPNPVSTMITTPPGEVRPGRSVVLTLAALVLTSFGIRFWLLQHAVWEGTFSAIDADGYLRNGRLLTQDGAGWQWTLKAIEYPWDGRIYVLPPLYPVFLSLFALVSDAYEYWAAVGQIALNAASVASLFVVGESLHSRRAGLIAACIYTFWLTSIWRFSLFIQEQLYVPLLITAFALLLRATARGGSPGAFLAAGVAFGGAALTRSMPMYFVVAVAVWCVLIDRNVLAVRRGAAFLAGFLLVTGAYSLWLSQQLGQFVYIENHAGISIQQYGGIGAPGVPGFGDIVRQLLGAFWSAPTNFLAVWSGYALSLFHLHADRWLHAYVAPTAERELVARIIGLAGIALPFITSVVLAPIGAVLARGRREAALVASWVVLVVVLTALSAAGGVRYRAPFEPHLIVLSAVVLAGGWRRPSRLATISGLCITACAVLLMLAQIPRVVRARANYGVSQWSGGEVSWRAAVVGSSGFNLLPTGGRVLEVVIHPSDHVRVHPPTRISVRIDGYPMGDRLLGTEAIRLRFPARHGGFHFVEVFANDAADNPATIEIEVVR